MCRDNVISVDFRISEDIRRSQVLSFAERMKASSARTQAGLRASNSALETIRLMLERDPPSTDRKF